MNIYKYAFLEEKKIDVFSFEIKWDVSQKHEQIDFNEMI